MRGKRICNTIAPKMLKLDAYTFTADDEGTFSRKKHGVRNFIFKIVTHSGWLLSMTQ
jgi:hypothetical protein